LALLDNLISIGLKPVAGDKCLINDHLFELLLEIFLEVEELAKPEENFFFNYFDFYLDDIDGIFVEEIPTVICTL
jgi:hypothetical protein